MGTTNNLLLVVLERQGRKDHVLVTVFVERCLCAGWTQQPLVFSFVDFLFLQVHFLAWAAKWDEVFSRSSRRLQRLHTFTKPWRQVSRAGCRDFNVR